MLKSSTITCLIFFLAFIIPTTSLAQNSDYFIVTDPEAVTLALGDSTTLTVQVADKDGIVQDQIRTFVYARDSKSLAVNRETGVIKALASGTFTVFAGGFSMEAGNRQRLMKEIAVNVPYPPVKSVAFSAIPAKAYEGTQMQLTFDVVDETGVLRDNVTVKVTSSNPDVATVDDFHNLAVHNIGKVSLFAEAEDAKTEMVLDVVKNPVAALKLGNTQQTARTGDVLSFKATAIDAKGDAVSDAPVSYAFNAKTDDQLGPAASGQIDSEGRFVAEKPGLYTILAMSGPVTARHTLQITPRDVVAEVELIGSAIIGDVHTSDLWVWEGVDGRDYAVTGTWGANGEAYFWDVSNPAAPIIVDTVTVDARTVNDVKVSEDGTICVISREGASNRRNGLLVLDCTNPYDVQIHAAYDENLTGGVHNVFVYQHHIYALSAGQRFDIINIEDPKSPHRVGSFELDTPGHSIHDVWVEDGIAYTSNWSDGVVMIDVGNGIAGGSVTNPVKITSYAYPSGWNHAAFPYHSEETGKRYIIAGDEAFPGGEAAGWIHFIDVTDVNNPQEVARYEVPEAGTHNLWVEDNKLYIAYYQGGLRVVDISGDLMGDLYKQGREIAKYKAVDPAGKIPNSPMAWGPQPYKGNIFFSDHNSGLWVIKLSKTSRKNSRISSTRGFKLQALNFQPTTCNLQHKIMKHLLFFAATLMFLHTALGQNYYVYVNAESEDEVALVQFDGENTEVIKTIPVGAWPNEIEGPHGITVDPDGKHWYLTLAHGMPFGSLLKFETGTDQLKGTVELGLYPATMQVSAATGLLYVVNFNLHGDHVPSDVSVVDPETMTEITRTTTGVMPHGSRLSPDGTRHYSVAMMSDALYEIDAFSFDVLRVLNVHPHAEIIKMHHGDDEESVDEGKGEMGHGMDHDHDRMMSKAKPTWVAPHPSEPLVYVANNGIDEVVEINTDTWKASRRFNTNKAPYNLDISPDGRLLVVTHKGAASIGVIDLSTGEYKAVIPSSRSVTHGVVISPDGKYAFATAEGIGGEPGSLDVFDLEKLERVATASIGKQAGGLAFWKMGD